MAVNLWMIRSYRLLVCGTTTIRDIAGNPLDGDGDGTSGDDFLRTYRVERTNIFRNGNFDCTIDNWIAVTTLPEEIEFSAEDFSDSQVSGSAQMTNLTASTIFALGQCVEVLPDFECLLRARLRIDIAVGSNLTLIQSCKYFSNLGCMGATLTSLEPAIVLGDSDGDWQLLEHPTTSPSDAVSALCSIDLLTATGEDFNVFFDAMSLSCLNLLFEDGFESGDTSAWSDTVTEHQ